MKKSKKMSKQPQIHDAKLRVSLIALGFSEKETDYIFQYRKNIKPHTLCSELEAEAKHTYVRLGNKNLQLYFRKIIKEYDKLLENIAFSNKDANILDAMSNAEKDIISQAEEHVSSKKSVLCDVYRSKKAKKTR